MIDRRRLLIGGAALALAPSAVASARPERLPDGMRRVEEVVDGLARVWHVYVPPGLKTPAPLVLALHGNGGDGAVMYRRNGWARTALEQGWIGVFPDCGAEGSPMGDQPFLRRVLDRALAEEPVDRSRVYVVGFSGGGKKAYVLAAQRSATVAAIAVASTRIGHREYEEEWSPTKNAARKVSVLHLHGLRDTRVPPASDTDPEHLDWTPVPMEEGLEIWARHDGARKLTRPPRPPGLPSRVRVHRWQADDGYAVVGLVDSDLTHRWANEYANAVMVDFLRSAPSR